MKYDPPRLEAFLKLLPGSYCHAVEFRHASWMQRDTFGLLRRHHAAHVSVSSRGMPMNLEVTSGLVYIRFHGLDGGPAHDYKRRELEPWADHICKQASAGKRVFVYFNNDANVRAPNNAKLLMRMIGEETAPALAEAA